MTHTSRELSLFEDYKRRYPDLGFGVNTKMTTEGASIFGNYVRAEQIDHLSRVLGGLAYSRSEEPLDAPIIVIDTSDRNDNILDGWNLRTAAAGVLEHLMTIEATTPQGITEYDSGGVVTREVQLITSPFVSVQIDQFARVVLSPESIAGA